MIIDIIKAVIIGIVEGITEWLPVSSTGHMILVNEFLRLDVSPEFMEMFLVVIQLGAILAVAALYFKRLFPFLPKQVPEERSRIFRLWGKIIISCLPAAVIGILFDDALNDLFYNSQTVAAALAFYGVVFIVIERGNKKRGERLAPIGDTADIPVKTALIIGIFQLLALIPGTSRSGATIIGAILCGASRVVAAEYSFFLAVPVMAGASGLKLLKFGFAYTAAEIAILAAGFVTAFIVSVAAIRFLTGFVKKRTFIGFGWYRIALAAVVAGYFVAVR